VSHTEVPPAPSECLSVCPPDTSGLSSHCPAERWTPWPYGTSPLPLPESPVSRQQN